MTRMMAAKTLPGQKNRSRDIIVDITGVWCSPSWCNVNHSECADLEPEIVGSCTKKLQGLISESKGVRVCSSESLKKLLL